MTVVRVREQGHWGGRFRPLLTRHSLPNFAVSCRVKVCPSAHANCWQKFALSCSSSGRNCCSASVPLWHKADILLAPPNVCFWG